MRRIRGQALAEFCVVMAALAPLMLLVPLVGKYADFVQTAEVASRYVAFESLAHDPLNGRLNDERIARDTARRFFSRSDVPIRTDEAPSNSTAERNMLWNDHRGDPLVADLTRDVAVTVRADTRDPFPAARPWWKHGLDLRDRNLITASVDVRMAQLPRVAPFDSLEMHVARSTALLVDDWTALGTRDVQLRIENAGVSVYPTSKLGELLRFIGVAPRLLTDAPMKPSLPDWEVVPCDRLNPPC